MTCFAAVRFWGRSLRVLGPERRDGSKLFELTAWRHRAHVMTMPGYRQLNCESRIHSDLAPLTGTYPGSRSRIERAVHFLGNMLQLVSVNFAGQGVGERTIEPIDDADAVVFGVA